ncbi:MAG: arylsulfatase [Bacteroidota bacterium]
MTRNFCLLFLLCSFLSFGQIQSDNLPNVVVVLADDIGLGDLAAYRSMHSDKIIVETPNLDQLMAEGMSFTDAHSPTALCAPSRYSIMTGNNTYHSYAPWGVWGSYQQTPIKETDMTLGKLMKQAGYQTAFFGKWHMGSDWHRKGSNTAIYRGPRNRTQLEVDVTHIADNGPKQQGFEYSLMYPAGIQDVPYAVYENEQWMPLQEDSEIIEITQAKVDYLNFKLNKDEGLGDSHWNPFEMGPLLAKKATEFIAKAEKARPFFMYYCSQAVHKPHTPPSELDGEKINGSTPTHHLDMVKELDTQIGMLVDALKAKGVYENTLFIFTSDNGGLNVAATAKAGHRSSDIYRGSKNQIYEGGHRVPFIATWPNEIKGKTTSNALLSSTDILATLAALTNQSLSAEQGIDSHNFLPILLQKDNAAPRKTLLLQSGTTRKVAYREGQWKLIIQIKKDEANEAIALFDLSNNLTEQEDKNLISQPKYKERIDRMYRVYHQVRYGK